MDYAIMSGLSKFGKRKWKSDAITQAALGADTAINLTISESNLDNYGPFTRMHFENNNSTVTIQVEINGRALGDNTLQAGNRTIFVQPNVAFDILPKEDNLLIHRVAIKNLHAVTATGATDIVWDIANW